MPHMSALRRVPQKVTHGAPSADNQDVRAACFRYIIGADRLACLPSQIIAFEHCSA